MSAEGPDRDEAAPDDKRLIRARNLARASVSLGAVTIWLAVLGLITTPYLISELGTSLYGVFALLTIMSAYLSNLELGFGHATVRFLARARAMEDVAEERAVIETSFSVFLVASTAACAAALLASGSIAETFINGADAQHHVVLDSVRLGAVILFTSLLASFASSSLSALGRLQFLVATRGIFGTLASGAAVGALVLGGGLRTILAAQVVVNAALCTTLLVGLARATHARLRPGLHLATFRIMGRFGVSILLAGLFFQALLQGPPTVLAGHSTIDQVAAFAVPSVIVQQLMVLLSVASLGFLPFASAESAASDTGRLAAMFRANVRMTVLATGPVFLYLLIWAHPLLSAWVDRGFADDAIGPLHFLAGAAGILALSAPAADVARGLGRPSWTVWYTAATAVITVAGCFLLVGRYGATGVAAALSGALVLTTVPFGAVVARHLLGLRLGELARALVAPTLAVGVAGAVFAGGRLFTSGVAGALIVGAVGTLVYVAIVLRAVLDPRERAVLGTLLPSRLRLDRRPRPRAASISSSESTD